MIKPRLFLRGRGRRSLLYACLAIFETLARYQMNLAIYITLFPSHCSNKLRRNFFHNIPHPIS